MNASIVIRTYNEERHLPGLLRAIADQETNFDWETIIVDSGSTDDTLSIASQYKCRVLRIERSQFSFGRSLNVGCQAAIGRCLAFISGHCIPVSRNWLKELLAPLGRGSVAYVYGAQYGNHMSKFSEQQLFAKWYPAQQRIPQDGFFCNNGNAALLKSVWVEHRFDEDLTGLEDMRLAQKLVERGYRIGYVPEASVYHLHHETWAQIKRRFEREAIALQQIMPEIHISFLDCIRYFLSAVLLDSSAALKQGVLFKTAREIALFRLMQFWGSYCGNHDHRKISNEWKEKYFFPK
jgi:rhamnosyltransferase